MPGITRRQYLASVGSLAVGLPLISGQAAADHWDEQPEHVTLSYNESVLERYQPLLILGEEDRKKLIAQYAWTATSPEYSTDCHVYWASYTHQEGVTEYDSHAGDHEPVYVFADSETGDVEEVVASVYHWLAGRVPGSAVRVEDSNPVLRVMSPHHHHTAASMESSTHRPSLADLTNAFDDWLANGMEDDLEPGTVVNPWRMTGPGARTHWWHDTIGAFSTDAMIVRTWRLLGRHEAGTL